MTAQNRQKLIKVKKGFYNLINKVPSVNLKFHLEKVEFKFTTNVLLYPNHPVRNLLQMVSHKKTQSHRTLIMPKCKTTLMRNSFVKYFTWKPFYLFFFVLARFLPMHLFVVRTQYTFLLLQLLLLQIISRISKVCINFSSIVARLN